MPWYLVEIDTIQWDFNEAFERGVFTTHGCRNTACAAIFKMQMKNRDALHQFDNHLIETASQNQQNSLWIYDEKLARCIDGEWLNSAVTKDCGFKYHLYKARLRYVSLLDTLVIVPNWRMKSTSTNCVVKRKVPQLHLLDVLKVEPFVPTLDKVYIR